MWSLLLLLAPLGVLCDVTVPVSQHWNGGFQAKACFDVTEELQSWTMHLIFDQPINSVDIWQGIVNSSSADKTEYVISNVLYNGVQHPDTQLCVEFQGHASGDVTPGIHATLEGVNEDGNHIQVTDQPPAQTLPSGQTWPPTTARVPGGRLEIRGMDLYKDDQKIFLSGANTAWVSYGYDFGNGQYQQHRGQYLHKLNMVHNAGGNSMRTWVHVHGATSPQFDSTGMVTALDKDGTFISDFKKYLDDAYARDILIFPCLWNGAVVQEQELITGDVVQMFQYIYEHGYQGAWVWSDDTEAAQAAGIKALNGQTGAAGLVNFRL